MASHFVTPLGFYYFIDDKLTEQIVLSNQNRSVTVINEFGLSCLVAAVLGYTKPENAISARVDSEDKTSTLIQGGNRGNLNMTVISEFGLYSMILSSKMVNF